MFWLRNILKHQIDDLRLNKQLKTSTLSPASKCLMNSDGKKFLKHQIDHLWLNNILKHQDYHSQLNMWWIAMKLDLQTSLWFFLDELDEFGVSKKIHRTVLNKEINHQVNGTSFLVFKQMFNVQFNFLCEEYGQFAINKVFKDFRFI